METFQPLGVGLVQSSSTVIPYRMGGIAAVRHKRVRWSTLEGVRCFAFARRVLTLAVIWVTSSWCSNGYRRGNFRLSTG